MQAGQQVAVSIVEDDRLTRDTLAALIARQRDLRFVAAYADAAAAVAGISAHRPDVVVMDMNLSAGRTAGIDGADAVAAVKAVHPTVQVLMLTIYDEPDRIFESLRAGASGYILKRTPPEKILEAIREVHAGGAPMSMHIARRVVESFSAGSRSAGMLDGLTTREREIVSLLAQGATDKQIAKTLGISSSTVRGHLHLIYGKLHVETRTQAVLKYLGH